MERDRGESARTFHVYRFDPDADGKARMQTFDLDLDGSERMLLDVLIRLKGDRSEPERLQSIEQRDELNGLYEP